MGRAVQAPWKPAHDRWGTTAQIGSEAVKAGRVGIRAQEATREISFLLGPHVPMLPGKLGLGLSGGPAGVRRPQGRTVRPIPARVLPGAVRHPIHHPAAARRSTVAAKPSLSTEAMTWLDCLIRSA